MLFATSHEMINQVAQARMGRRISALLFSDATRPLRFVCTGGFAGLIQLGLLALLTHHGWYPNPANALAFLLAAQVNFALSHLFTWRDRRANCLLWQRWLMFHGSIAGMAVLNMLVFMASRTMLPTLMASAAGIAVAATGNFVVGDRVVFRVRGYPRWSRLYSGEASGVHVSAGDWSDQFPD